MRYPQLASLFIKGYVHIHMFLFNKPMFLIETAVVATWVHHEIKFISS